MESKRGVSLLVVIFLPMLALAVHVIGKEPGYGYPGTLLPYRASRELKEQMAKFGLKAGRFVRNALPADYLLPNEKFALEDISYLLYTPRRVAKSVPMVVYFSGTGEQGDDLMCEFGQTTVFEKLTVEEFQKKGSSCMTVGGFPLHKFAWPLFYGLLSRSSGPRNFD